MHELPAEPSSVHEQRQRVDEQVVTNKKQHKLYKRKQHKEKYVLCHFFSSNVSVRNTINS